MLRKILKSSVFFSFKPLRFFSGSLPEPLLKYRKKLVKTLEAEIEHEQKTDFIDSSIENTLKELDFEFIDNPLSNIVELRKEKDEYRFLINFQNRKPKAALDDSVVQIEGKNVNPEEEDNEMVAFTVFFLFFAVFLILSREIGLCDHKRKTSSSLSFRMLYS